MRSISSRTSRGEHVRLTHVWQSWLAFLAPPPRAPFPIPICCGADTLEKSAGGVGAARLSPQPHRAPAAHAAAPPRCGVLLPSLLNPIFSLPVTGDGAPGARRPATACWVATSDYQPEREAAIVEHMLRQRVAGLVLTVADADNSAVLTTLHEAAGLPFVLAHNVPQHSHWPSGVRG